MNRLSFTFPSNVVDYYFDAEFQYLEKLADKENTVLLTDKNLLRKHKGKFAGWKIIAIDAGEQYKVQATVDSIVGHLIELGADRKTTLVGVGGGVITDMAGYVAGIYMRGLRFGFVPTSVLAMVDAAIGGKNGVDVGVFKNMVGLIRQPSFLLYDFSFLKTLPRSEWINGFAEVIKHACIRDAHMFKLLEQSKLSMFQQDKRSLVKLIKRNALLKTGVVIADEFEKAERKQLNFGHTLGHAIENLYGIPHGHAVSIGIGVACKISENVTGFKETNRVVSLLKQYGLPPQFQFDAKQALNILKSDKKKEGQAIAYIVLDKIGRAKTVSLPFDKIEQLISNTETH